MLLTPAQATIARDRHRFRVICCGRRFGKTIESAEEIKGKALARPCRISYIAPTYQQARDIMWEHLKKEMLPATIAANEARLELRIRTQHGGESLIVLRGWESVENHRGQAFDLLVLDEVAKFKNFWVMWREVLRPTLTDRKGEAIFTSTPRGFNHFYDLYGMELTDTDYKSFHYTSYDNPHVDSTEIDKARQELPEDSFAQEYLADFRKMQGLVYREFERTRHLFDDTTVLPEMVEYFAGVDFGFTNPTAVIFVKRDKDNAYWVTAEWYKTQRTDVQVAEFVADCGFNRVYPDPESPSAIRELHNKHVNVVEVLKNKDSIKNGISKIRELFKQNRLKIHKSCVNLIAELETYSYPEPKPGANEEENPVKDHDHALDALRYAIASNFKDTPVYEDVGEDADTNLLYPDIGI